MAVSSQGRVTGSVTVTKKKPIEPDWHKALLPLAKNTLWKTSGSSEVIAFKNMCRKLARSRVLASWAIEGGSSVYSAKWVAHDPQWSGSV